SIMVVAGIVTASGFSGMDEEEGTLERPFGRFGAFARQLDFRSAEELGTRDFERNDLWMLEPTTFEMLSTSGKLLALRSKGLIQMPSEYERVVGAGGEELRKSDGRSDNIRVNNPKFDTILHTQSESSIAVAGSNIIISFNDINNSDITAYAFSTDGGKKFVQRQLPNVTNGINFGDGVVAFGPNGEAYYSTLALSSGMSIIPAAKSTDKGKTFSVPVNVSTTASSPRDIQDKEWLTVDTSDSPFRGNVYVSWTHFTLDSAFINFSRSTDGGATFEPPLILSPKDT